MSGGVFGDDCSCNGNSDDIVDDDVVVDAVVDDDVMVDEEEDDRM